MEYCTAFVHVLFVLVKFLERSRKMSITPQDAKPNKLLVAATNCGAQHSMKPSTNFEGVVADILRPPELVW